MGSVFGQSAGCAPLSSEVSGWDPWPSRTANCTLHLGGAGGCTPWSGRGVPSRAPEWVGAKAVLHDWAVQAAGLCAQQVGSAIDSGCKAASGRWAPLPMGVEVMLCSCTGLSDGLHSCPGPPARLACQAGPEAMSSSCLGGVVEWALPPEQPAGCAPRLGRTADRAPWPGRAPGLGLQMGRAVVWDQRSGITPAGTPTRSADSPL